VSSMSQLPLLPAHLQRVAIDQPKGLTAPLQLQIGQEEVMLPTMPDAISKH
jgi:hypothetical protein